MFLVDTYDETGAYAIGFVAAFEPMLDDGSLFVHQEKSITNYYHLLNLINKQDEEILNK